MKEDGGPAFPNVIEYVPEHERERYCEKYKLVGGMSLRDWFAGMALGGMIGLPFKAPPRGTFDSPEAVCEVHAKDAYTMADAMIAERGKDA